MPLAYYTFRLPDGRTISVLAGDPGYARRLAYRKLLAAWGSWIDYGLDDLTRIDSEDEEP